MEKTRPTVRFTAKPGEIVDDEVMEEGATLIHKLGPRAVTRLPGGIAKKWDLRNLEDEARTMRVAESAGLPVPHVHGTGMSPMKKYWIAMDYIEGQTLAGAWNSYSKEEKSSVAKQLGEILVKMRQMPPPENHIGGAHVGDQGRDLVDYGLHVYPACKDEAEFNAHIVESMGVKKPKAFRRAIADQLRTDHRIVFTHGDLALRNIIVQGPKVVSIIDWELGGWYPEYWDYAKCLCGIRASDFFDHADEIFPESYPEELVTMTAHRIFQ
ncbi:hypothetical protein F503_02194 [Ophiostoma piceae UAMH 11346]|uniref:non-specific serine/threonine protein kinase n=1 Tax=Ophiostoma piceae (strain UAMH 11346) TaxID=1262450 RepID=S3CX83_OPHP1|nr:hypothetical protein F503_02194 [Ophiostoma piceae UAMH 11346]